MEDIKMVSLKAQYAKLKPELDQAFSAVMESMQLLDGPQVNSFARQLEDYMQVVHALPCAHGTDALQLALTALALPAGGEVILPAFCYDSAVEAVALLGLKPVFADVLPDTFTIDPASVSSLITPRTVALMPVHLFGQCADMAEILSIADKHRVLVLEDNSQSLGAAFTLPDKTTKYAGAFGDIAITSFFPSKPILGMDEGGAVLTNNPVLAGKLEEMLVPRQSKSDELNIPGAPSCLATLEAAMLEVKLKYLNEFIEARRRVAEVYDRLFERSAACKTPVYNPKSTHVFQQYTIKVPGHLRNDLKLHLQQHFIPSMVYYPQPLHLQEAAYRQHKYKAGDLPVSEELSRSVLSLPLHSELTEEQQAYIAHHTIEFLEKHG